MVRPVGVRRWVTGVGGVVVAALILAVAVPAAVASRYANVQAGFVKNVFENNQSATAPDVEAADPWGGRDRVNVLLLGGDGGPYREGVRTDSMILVSIDTHTGRAVSFSLPRNMMNAPFPENSPLHDVFPNGLHRCRATPASWMLNAVYREVPILYPHILGTSTNEGADAIKQAFEGATGLPVDYYVLINFQGFQQMVNAIGGVTVNINEPVAVNGDTDAGIPPDPLPAARARPAPRRLRRAVVRPRAVRRRRLPADGPAALHDPGDRRRRRTR